MKTSLSPALLPPEIHARLSVIAARGRRITLAGCVARVAGAFLLLALAGMMADRMFRFFHPAWRWLATLTVMAGTVCAAWLWRKLVKWKASPLAAAQAAEQAVPGLEERWSTLASLSGAPESMRGAGSLLTRVRDEASGFAATVPERTGAGRSGFFRGLVWLSIGAGVMGAFCLSDWAGAGVRWQRLLAPWSNASLTKVSVFPEDVPAVVPRHEVWDLQAKVTGRAVPYVDLVLQDSSGKETNVRLGAGEEPGLFTHTLRDPQESFSFRFRAGDGQTPWHRVKVADRPVIASAGVLIAPPAYTGQEAERHPGIPPSVRALEGSRLVVSVATGGSGNDVSLLLRRGTKNPEQTVQMARGDDGHYRWEALLTESLQFYPVLKNTEGLTNKTPPVCVVDVILDKPPVVTLAENSAAHALTPEDTIEVAFSAMDDVGIQQAEVVVKLEKQGEPAKEIVVPVDLGKEKGARRVDKRVGLDLKKLPLEPGMKISYAVKATDGKGTQGEASGKQNGGKPGEQTLVKASDKKNGSDSKGDGAPPGDMGMRQLDVGQCSCSSHKDLEIENYTGDSPAFREKETIPVLPVLEKITKLVRSAIVFNNAARNDLPANQPLDESRLKSVSLSLAQVQKASGECDALTAKTKDTPYALIGLQLRDLRIGELVPAEESLTESTKQAEPGPPLVLADVHLHAALTWLEKLTKEAAAIQKTEAVEALAQKLKQMHRIYLEDTMELLKKSGAGGEGGPELGTVEVSEEYARLLKERMEKLRDLMKEFAKLLESDPSLLARFMDQQNKGAVALQERLKALLAEQQSLNVHTASLSESVSGAARGNAAAGIKAECQAMYQTLALEMAGVLRSATTWFPKGTAKDQGPGADLLKSLRAATAALHANSSATITEIDRAMEALNRLSVIDSSADYANRRKEELIPIRLTAVWLESLQEAAAARNLGRIAELKQRELARRTREFTERIERGIMQIAAKWPVAEKAAMAVQSTLYQGVLPHQRAAGGFLHQDHWAEGKASQREAAKGLAAAADAWKAMINLIAEEMRKNPPKPPPAPDPSTPNLDDLMALMDKEMSDFDDFGLPKWSSNIEIITDWQKQCSSPARGMMPVPSPTGAMRAAQERERALEKEAAKAQQAANAQARARAERQASEKTQSDADGSAAGKDTNTAAARRNDWNRLPSELNKDLRQQNDHPPPEEYRRAVETYFRRIGVENAVPASAP